MRILLLTILLTFLSGPTMAQESSGETVYAMVRMDTNNSNAHYFKYKPQLLNVTSGILVFQSPDNQYQCLKRTIRLAFYDWLKENYPEHIQTLRGYNMKIHVDLYMDQAKAEKLYNQRYGFKDMNNYKNITYTEFQFSPGPKNCAPGGHQVFMEDLFLFQQLTRDPNWVPGQ